MARVRPVVSEMDGVDSPGRKQGVRLPQGLAAVLEWTLRDDAGNPADLSAYLQGSASSSSSTADGAVTLLLIECLSLSTSAVPLSVAGAAVTPADGVVRATLPAAATRLPGVYDLEWRVTDAAGDLVHVTQGSMIVDRGLAGDGKGPPTVAELRLHLRDSGAEDNYLLDTIEFDLAEVAACIERPVRLWNETLEFVGPRYTTQNYPYRSQWLDATIGYLHMLAAHNYDRNLQEYQAGGTAMRDKAKGNLYLQKSQLLLGAYGNWVKQRKGQLNMEAAFGSTASGRCG